MDIKQINTDLKAIVHKTQQRFQSHDLRISLQPLDLLMQDTQKVTSKVMPFQALLDINSTAT